MNKVTEEEQSVQSTYNRWKRDQQFSKILNIDDALRLLGHTQKESYSIFRSPNDLDNNIVTHCTVHINFHTLEFLVYENNQPTFVYDLNTLFTERKRKLFS